MTRISLTDGSGRWFNPRAAQAWDEGCTFDGRNYISDATGSQWDHERLYHTAGGRWILRSWSQWQGSRTTYEEVTPAAAAVWLIRNGHELHESCAAQAADLEMT